MSANSYKVCYKINLTLGKKEESGSQYWFQTGVHKYNKNPKQMLLHMTNFSDLGKTTHVLLFLFHSASCNCIRDSLRLTLLSLVC